MKKGEVIMNVKSGTLEGMLQEEQTNYTIDGKCSDCGNCCSNILPMSDAEVKKIKKYIDKHGIKAQNHLAPLAEPWFDMLCPFADLSREKKCTIYPVRPQICRSFICSKTLLDGARDPELLREERPVRNVRMTFYGGKK